MMGPARVLIALGSSAAVMPDTTAPHPSMRSSIHDSERPEDPLNIAPYDAMRGLKAPDVIKSAWQLRHSSLMALHPAPATSTPSSAASARARFVIMAVMSAGTCVGCSFNQPGERRGRPVAVLG